MIAMITGKQLLEEYEPRRKAGEIHLASLTRKKSGYELQFYPMNQTLNFERENGVSSVATVHTEEQHKPEVVASNAVIPQLASEDGGSPALSPVPAGSPQQESNIGDLPDWPDVPEAFAPAPKPTP